MDLFFDLLRSVIYGVIEGITEWLPISSTGQQRKHLAAQLRQQVLALRTDANCG